ncbi:RHS repeat protein [Emticicia sp. BO119]|uniref:RHS repeat protein n=1 Tax=Emticicia sp. BO119 TaxID=2757768 RepID=UPI0015F10757|nr:RHS repeat protein [Emticicia sp. BO119]MBA4849358.1 RHS repeat protein [Emticicia sp. BO119]
MKNHALILLIILISGCSKESADPKTPSAPGKKLISLTLNNKPYITFEFQNDLLIKENSFSFCEINPTDEFTYEYTDRRLSKLKTTMRSMFSSISALCNPSLGMKSEETFQYNAEGQISKIVRNNSITAFVYNSNGWVEKQVTYGDANPLVSTYEYDSKGNIIKETDIYGESVFYTYDDKINPYYLIKQKPQWLSAFNKSPNNVLKATGRYNFVRVFKYDSEGYPTEVLEDNGLTYKYNYE